MEFRISVWQILVLHKHLARAAAACFSGTRTGAVGQFAVALPANSSHTMARRDDSSWSPTGAFKATTCSISRGALSTAVSRTAVSRELLFELRGLELPSLGSGRPGQLYCFLRLALSLITPNVN